MNNLGRVLKQIRIFNYLTQAELADKISISRSYLSQIESGLKVPSLEVLKKYENAFNIRLSAILLFAEDWNEKKSLQAKFKKILSEKTLQFLEFITTR